MPTKGYTWNPLGFIAAALGIGLCLPNIALAQMQATLSPTIADNDSIFIDGKNFKVVSGRAKGEAATLIKELDARELGSSAIVFRSGQKLYIVSTPLHMPDTYNQLRGNTHRAYSQVDQPSRIKIRYDAPSNPDLQEIYGRLRDHDYLDRIQQILSPLRLPEELTIKTTQCGMMNAWYRREHSNPVVTVCYELLNNILHSLPKKTTSDGVTLTDAAVGQSLWLALHEVGHAVFDIFDIPVFGHEEDAADNFATYVMLQLGKQQAKRLISGAAWAWRGYIADYRANPVIQAQLIAFASNHGQPQERFYNLMCLAYGADPVTFADLTTAGFLPPNRVPSCKYEYKTLAHAFHAQIGPHIDKKLARLVMDSAWLPAYEFMPAAQK